MILSTRLIAALVVILALALALLTVLNYFKFSSTLSEIQDSRVSVVSLDIADTIQAATDLGLKLSDVSDTQAVINRALERDPQLTAITVFDRRGSILFQVRRPDSDAPDGAVRDSWRTANRASEGRLWRTETAQTFVVGAPIRNTFGLVAGGVATQVSREPFLELLARMRHELERSATVIFVGFAALGAIVVVLMLRRLTRTAKRMEMLLGRLVAAPESAVETVGDDSALVRDFDRFRGRTREALLALTNAERSLTEH